MAVARKCDRCGVYYDEYNVKNNAGKNKWYSFC